MYRIAVVEDDSYFRELLITWLRDRYHVVSFENPQGLIALIERGDRFDLILSDIAMPVMDGWELISRVRENPTLQEIPSFALSAHVTEADQRKVLAAGFDEYLPKPVDLEFLVGKIEEYLP